MRFTQTSCKFLVCPLLSELYHSNKNNGWSISELSMKGMWKMGVVSERVDDPRSRCVHNVILFANANCVVNICSKLMSRKSKIDELTTA